MSSNRPDVVSCGAVVYRKTPEGPLYLLLQYGARHWDFAKGHMEAGETEEQTARREVEEEAGIDDLVFLPDFRRAIRYSYRQRARYVRKMVIFFLARTKIEPAAVKISHEHIGYAWHHYKEARKALTFNNAKRVLQDAHQYLLKEAVP